MQPTTAQMNSLRRLAIQYNGWTRSHTRLTNQIKGYCRMYAGEIGLKRSPASDALCKQLDDLGEEAIETRHFSRPDGFDLALWAQIEPLLYARLPVAVARMAASKNLEQAAGKLPIAGWMERIKGVGLHRLGLLVGVVDPGRCETVAKFWFLLSIGIAKDGLAQRRWKTERGEDDPKWKLHKYSPARRALVWNIGDGLIKAQVRKVKDENGKDTGERRSLGTYGQMYLDRKAYEKERNPDISDFHAHRRAQRYMEKAFLRDLWLQWTGTPWQAWGTKAA